MSILRRGLRRLARWLLAEPDGVRRAIQGRNNQLEAQGATLVNVELDIIGNDNRIVLGEGGVFHNVRFRLRGDGHRIEFGPGCRITRGALIWFEDDHCTLQVGQGTTMVEVHIAVTEPGSKILIGEDCMFANDIDIRSGDSHSIVDAVSGERLNFAEDVIIGRHVWIAPHVVVLKGVQIGDHSVIATGSIVTKSCPPNSLIAGNPARVVRTGISWKRERSYHVETSHDNH